MPDLQPNDDDNKPVVEGPNPGDLVYMQCGSGLYGRVQSGEPIPIEGGFGFQYPVLFEDVEEVCWVDEVYLHIEKRA